MEPTAGSSTMEEIMVQEATVITSTSGSTFAYGSGEPTKPFLDIVDKGRVDRIFQEAETDAGSDRPALRQMISLLRAEDLVVVCRFESLARDLRDMQDMIG